MLHPSGRKWKLFLGLPSNGSVCDFQNYVLRDLVERYSDEIEFVWPEQLCQRIFHDYARNGIVEDFLNSGADMIWFLDSDICPPKFVLDLITKHGDKWQCAGAPYPVFMAQPNETERQVVFTCYKQIQSPDNKPRVAPCPIPMEGTEFIDGIATGCLFIKREVFEKLERPYFDFKYDPETKQPIEGEDIGFIIKMCRLGIKFFVDYSMVCKHWKNNIDLLEVNNYAMNVANKFKIHAEAELAAAKGQLEEVAKRFKRVVERNKELEALVAKQASAKIVDRAGKPLIYR
jgi:hypothetical protein